MMVLSNFSLYASGAFSLTACTTSWCSDTDNCELLGVRIQAKRHPLSGPKLTAKFARLVKCILLVGFSAASGTKSAVGNEKLCCPALKNGSHFCLCS